MRINFIICVALTWVFSACQKPFKAPADTPISTDFEFKAQINGVPFEALLAGAVRRSDSIISIAGKSLDGKILTFTLVDSGIHKYTLTMDMPVNYCGYEDNNGLAFSSYEGIEPGDSGGDLSITMIDPVKRVMTGNFSLKVFRQLGRIQRTITDGIFKNIRY